MNAEELYFVNEYIVSNRKERVAWELNRDHKRADCIWRFAHGARDILIPSLIRPVRIHNGVLVLDGKSFRHEIGDPLVYIMHPSNGWDRVVLSFQNALDDYLGRGPYIMIDLEHTFAFVETESCCETHEFLYMHK